MCVVGAGTGQDSVQIKEGRRQRASETWSGPGWREETMNCTAGRNQGAIVVREQGSP